MERFSSLSLCSSLSFPANQSYFSRLMVMGFLLDKSKVRKQVLVVLPIFEVKRLALLARPVSALAGLPFAIVIVAEQKLHHFLAVIEA